MKDIRVELTDETRSWSMQKHVDLYFRGGIKTDEAGSSSLIDEELQTLGLQGLPNRHLVIERRLDMSETKNEWELKREAATECWKAMTPTQQDAILTLLKAWVPIRSRVSEFCTLDYDDSTPSR